MPVHAEEGRPTWRSHALLVGCTRYPSLNEDNKQLKGPKNDVVKFRELLLRDFHFQEDAIVTLAEHLGKESLRPTRANIIREFERLIGAVKPGDQVVILLAGHGSQQPDNDPDDGDDDEPDGFDETFWPADVGSWDESKKTVANAIVDDEICGWLSRIQDVGAFVFFVADSCHSGTLTRGNRNEVSRHVDSAGVVPQDELNRAHLTAARRATGNRRVERNDLPKTRAGIVALFAAQPDEPEPDTLLPRNADQQEWHGLLTYTILEVLTPAKSPLTYRELSHQVHQRYIQTHWTRWPTPSLEGTHLDREILGQKDWPHRPQYALSRTSTGMLSLNAGSLHGFTKGSILAVFRPAGAEGADQILGHVRIDAVRSLDCKVVPCEFAGSKIPESLADGDRVQLVYQDFGELRLRVAVDGQDTNGQKLAEERRDLLTKTMVDLSQNNGSLFRFEKDAMKADWLVRSGSGEIFLVPASGFARREWNLIRTNSETQAVMPSPLYGPGKINEGLPEWLRSRLQRIARVSNLHQIVNKEAEKDDAINIAVEVERVSESGAESTVVANDAGIRIVQEGESVRFRVHNRGTVPIDVTLLFVDANYGITSWLPRRGKTDSNRIDPDKSLRSVVLEVTAASEVEHLIAIAVRAEPQRPRAEFTCLEQDSLERARSSAGSGEDPLESPLGKLLQNAMFATGQTRGARPAEMGRYILQRISWRVVSPQPDK